MEKAKLRETRNKSVKKIEPTLSQGKNKKDSIDSKIPKKSSHNALLLNIGNPVSHYGTEKVNENNSPKKPSFTPTNYKDANISLKTNLDYRLNTNQPLSDEYKNIQESTNNKITGSIRIIDDIKKRIEEMKSEENKYKVYDKNLDGNVDKLIKNLKNELFDISKNIKTSEEKMESFFKTCSKAPIKNDKQDHTEIRPKHDDQGFNIVLSDLKKKNDELLSELNFLRENFNDVKKQNSELKDKIVSNEKTSKHIVNMNSQGIESKLIKPLNNLDNFNTKNENILLKNMSDKIKEKDLLIQEKEEKIRELKNQISSNERSASANENKFNSMQNIVSELISKNRKNERVIKDLNDEINLLNKDKILDLNFKNTKIHKLYLKDKNNAWALVSKKIDTKINELLNNYTEGESNWVKLNSIDKYENYNFSNVTNLYEIEEKFEKVIEDYDKVCKEYEEAQKFIVENIQNKENTLKEIQLEFNKYEDKIRILQDQLDVKKNNETNLLNENTILKEKLDKSANNIEFLNNQCKAIREENDNLKKEYEKQCTMIKKNKVSELEKISNLENDIKAKYLPNLEVELNKALEENKNLNSQLQNLVKANNKREMILQAALEKADKLKEEKASLLENLKNIESEKNEITIKLNQKNEELTRISNIEQKQSIESDYSHLPIISKNDELSNEIMKLNEIILIEKEKNEGLCNIVDSKTKELNELQTNMKNYIKKEMLMQSAIEKAEKLKEEKNLILEQLKRLEKNNEELKAQINEKIQIIQQLQDNLQNKIKNDIDDQQIFKEQLDNKELIIINLNKQIQTLQNNLQEKLMNEDKYKEFQDLIQKKDQQIYSLTQTSRNLELEIVNLSEEKKNLIKEIKENKECLDMNEQEIKSLNGGNSKLKEEIQNHMIYLESINNQIKEQTIKIDTLSKENYILTSKIDQNNTIISELNRELNIIREENNQLIFDCKGLTDKNLEIVNYTVEYQEKYSKISNENSKLMEKIKMYELNITNLNEANSLRNEELKNLQEEILRLSKINDDLNVDINDKTKKISLYEKNINEKNKANLDLKSSLEGRDIELLKHINLVKNITNEKVKFEEESLKLKKELDYTSQQYSILQNQMIVSEEEKRNILMNLKELEEKYSSIKVNFENYLHDTQKEMLELKTKLDNESQTAIENKKLTESVSKIKQELENTNFALLERIALLEEAFKNNKTEGENVEDLKKQYLDLTKEYEANNIKYQNNISELNNTLNSAKSKLKTMEEEMDNKSNIISSQKESLDRLKQEINQKEQIIKEQKYRIEEFKDQNSKMTINMTKINESFDSQINTVNVENQVLKLNINNLRKIIEENEINQIKDKESKLKDLEELNLVIEEKNKAINKNHDEIRMLKEDMANYHKNEKQLCEENLKFANQIKTYLQTIDKIESYNKNLELEKSNLLKVIEVNDSNLIKKDEMIKSLIENNQKELNRVNENYIRELDHATMKSSQIETLLKENSVLQEKLKESNQQITALQESNNILQGNINTLDSLHKEKLDEIFDLNRKYNNLKEENIIKIDEIKSSLQQLISNLNSENLDYKEKIQQLSLQIDSSEKDKLFLDSKIEELQHTIINLENIQKYSENDKNSVIIKLENDLKKANEYMKEKVNEIQNLLDNIEQNRHKFEEIKKKENYLLTIINDKDQSINDLNKENKDLKLEVEELKNEISNIVVKYNNIQSQLNELIEKTKLKENENEMKMKKIRLLEETQKEMETINSKELVKYQEENKTLKDKFEQKVSELESFIDKNNQLYLKNEQLIINNQELNKQIHDLSSFINNNQDINNELNREVNEAKNIIESLHNQLALEKEKYIVKEKETLREIDELNKKIEKLNLEFVDKEERLIETKTLLIKELDDCKRTIENLNNQLILKDNNLGIKENELNKELYDNEQVIQSLKDQLSSQLKAFKEKEEQMNKELNESQPIVQFLKNELLLKDSIISEKEYEFNNKINDTNKIIDTLKQEISLKQTILEEKEIQIENVQQENRELRKINEEILNKNTEIEEKLDVLNTDNEKFEEILKENKEKESHLLKEIQKKSYENDELHSLINKLQELNQSYELEIEMNKNLLKEKDKEIEELNINNINLKNESKNSNELNVKIQNLIKQNNINSNKIIEATEENTRLKDTIAQLKNNSESLHLNEITIKNEILNDELNTKANEIIRLNEELINCKLKIDDNNKIISENEASITNLKSRLNDLESTIKEHMFEIDKLNTEKSELIDKYDNKYNLKDQEKIKLDLEDKILHLIKNIADKDKELVYCNNRLRQVLEQLEKKNVKSFLIKNEKNSFKTEDTEEMIQFYKSQLDDLRALVVEKENIIVQYENEKKLRFEAEKNIIDEVSIKPISDLNISSNTQSLNFDGKSIEKIEKMKTIIKAYKDTETNLINQNNILKIELKECQERTNKILNFEGKIKNYEEFKVYLGKVLENYKPKKDKKEYEDALKYIREHTLIGESSQDKKKEGFFNNLFK